MNAWDKIKKWLTGSEAEARAYAERHLPKVSIGLPTVESGDRQDDADGLETGGVVWPVEQGSHGAVSFLSSACFYADYDKKKKRVHMLDNVSGKRHPGQIPLIVGDNVFPVADVGGKGLVVRTAEFGTDGIYKNVFIPCAPGVLKAHHLPPDQPINSTPVLDEDGREGGLHYALRVRQWVRAFCQGATGTAEKIFAPLLNFTRNGDGTPAHGAVHFRASEAALSHEAGGPLAPADDGNHRLGQTGEAPIHSGGINISRALYGDTGAGIIYSPSEFINLQWQPGGYAPFVMRVEHREDFLDKHGNACGKDAKGRKKWQTWSTKAGTDAAPKAPFDEPGPKTGDPPTLQRDPNTGPKGDDDPGIKWPILPGGEGLDDPGPKIDPPGRGGGAPDPKKRPGRGIQNLPGPDTERPTNTGPNEEEQPSIRGIAVPDFDPPKGTGFDEAYSLGLTDPDEIWQRAVGFTQREFFDFRRVSHDVAQGVAAMALPSGVTSSPTLMKAYLHSTLVQDGSGVWYGKRGNAIGFQTLMPGGLEGHMAYKARHGTLLTETKQLTRLLLNYKNTAGFEAKTLFGMGMRVPETDLPGSGFAIKLDYVDSSDTPHIDIITTDENGLADGGAGGQELRFNGVALGTGGSGDVVGPASAVADSLAMYDGTTGKLIKDGKVMMGTTSIGAGVTPDTQTLKPVPAASHGVILILEAQPAIGANTDGAGISLRAGAKTGAGADGTGELFTAGAAVAVNVGQTTKMTTVKGTLNVDEATTLDSTLAVAAKTTVTIAAVAAPTLEQGQDASTGPWEKTIPFELTTDGTAGLQTIIDIAEIASSSVTITYDVLVIRSDTGRHDCAAGWASFSHDGAALVLLADTQPHNTGGGHGNVAWVASGTNMRLQITPGGANVYRVRGFARVSHCTSGA